MPSRAPVLATIAFLVLGIAAYCLGVIGFYTGDYASYYAGNGGAAEFWIFMGVLLAAASFVSGGILYRWHVNVGKSGSTRGPRWIWGSLAAPIALCSLGVTVYLAAPLCNPPPGILWPTYCGVGPSAQQTAGALLVLIGFLTLPVTLVLCISTRHIPIRSSVSPVD
jgi:hypothetical protein